MLLDGALLLVLIDLLIVGELMLLELTFAYCDELFVTENLIVGR